MKSQDQRFESKDTRVSSESQLLFSLFNFIACTFRSCDFKGHLTPKYFFASINLWTCSKYTELSFRAFLNQILTIYRLQKLRVICPTTEPVSGIGLVLTWRHTALHTFLQRHNATQISLWGHVTNRLMPLSCYGVGQVMARFRQTIKISIFQLVEKGAKRRHI